MRFRLVILLGIVTALACAGFANDKKKPTLPATVLSARTVAVMVDPDAGVSADYPLGDKTAVEDVEKAFANWGRFKPVMRGMSPDLVVVIHKGNGKLVQPTVHGPSPNDRPVIIQPNDTGIRIGGQKGRSPSDDTQNDPQGAGPGVGVGASEDSFFVYDGTVDGATGRAPLWRYVAKNALHSHDVPAVGEFRKIVEETEKQLQKQQQKKP